MGESILAFYYARYQFDDSLFLAREFLLGVTPGLGIVSRLILIVLMFFGRVGGLTLIFAAVSGTRKTASKLPEESLTIG